MKSSLSLAALAFASSALTKEDVLYSKRHSKRFVDDNGNYNMCTSTSSTASVP